MKHDIVIGGSFTVPPGGIISARSAASATEWSLIVGKSGAIWLYRLDSSSVWTSGGPGSRGCGGSTVSFPVAEGLGEIHLVGPWHSNADSFFRDTGIDIKNNFVTWGCVGTGYEYDENTGRHRITGITHFDEEPTKGRFERFELIAWEMQERDPDVKLFSYVETEGGASYGAVSMPYSVRVARGLQKPIEEIMGW